MPRPHLSGAVSANYAPAFAGGAYVSTVFLGMYAPLRIQESADMPENGTSAPPPIRGGAAGRAEVQDQEIDQMVISLRNKWGIE